MPRLYTARPLHVEAVQFRGDNREECAEFLGSDFEDASVGAVRFLGRTDFEVALFGDWIVRHPSGWFQVVPNDAFLASYMEV